MRVCGYELPFGRRVAGLASEVAAGSRVLEELADDIAGGVHEHPDGDVYVAADLFPDESWDVWKVLVEDEAQNFGLLSRKIRTGRRFCWGGGAKSRFG